MTTPNNPDFSLDAKRKIVKAVTQVLGTNTDNTVTPRVTFPRNAALPNPQYQGMVVQSVAQNQLGCDLIKAHPLFA